MVQKIKENVKAITTFIGAIHLWGLAVFEDGEVAGSLEWWGLVGVVVTTFTVWGSANAPSAAQLHALDEAIKKGK